MPGDPEPGADRAFRRGLAVVGVRRLPDAPDPARDLVAVEEPLQIQVSGDPVATTMRTPGHDRELAVGYLFSEGIIHSKRDLSSIAHCGQLGEEERENTLEITPAPGVVLAAELDQSRRRSPTSSACGVCGRRSIDDLKQRCRPVTDDVAFSRTTLLALFERLAGAQSIFAQTGGVHAAALANPEGRLICSYEDIGRHNAVDKVIGRMILDDALPARGLALLVTSRAGFEIVHKAALAQVPVVACLSAATSLAVRTANAFGLTLIGFARPDGFNVYTGAERVVGD